MMTNLRQRTINRRWAIYLLVVSLLGSAALACGSSSGDDELMCRADLTYEGETYTGRSETAEQAELNACNIYCLENDPEVEAMYQIWLSSPEGQAADGLPKEEAIYESDALLDQVTLICSPACVASANSGEHELETSCE